jgi:hypothetical protein
MWCLYSGTKLERLFCRCHFSDHKLMFCCNKKTNQKERLAKFLLVLHENDRSVCVMKPVVVARYFLMTIC